MTVNQQSVEETKQQIRVLVNEIAAIGKSGVPAEEYYPQFLQRVITALAAVGGAIWLLDEDRKLRLQYQINLGDTLLDEEADEAQRHNRLLRRIAGAGQSLLVPPYSGTADNEAEGNPTRFLLVLTPLRHDKQVDGLIEIVQRPEASPATQQGYLRFLQQMAELAGEWLKNQRLAHFSDRQVLWQQADTFARLTHESLDLKQTAYVVANEGRRLIGCDRVSVAILKGRQCKVQAISGQDTIENRSNIVAALNKLATRVVAAGEPLWHDGSAEDLPPQIEEALEDYVDQSYGRHIAVLPLREPSHDANQSTGAAGAIDRDGAHRGETIGALIVEQIESGLPADVFHTRVNLVYEHGTRAIANALQHENLFLMPVWRTLGRLSWIIKARTLPKTLTVAALLLAVVLGLIFIPLELELEANGTLQPDVQSQVFAPIDGEVISVLIKDASRDKSVKAGDPVVELRNRELELKMTELQGQLSRAQEEILSVKSQLSKRTLEPNEADKLQGEELRLATEIETLKQSIRLREEQRSQLVVRAPYDGVITTWDLEKTLLNRPVVTGQVLFEVADLTKPMHLRLNMPDKRMDHLERYLAEVAADPKRTTSAIEGQVDVDFILATDPDRSLSAALNINSIERRTITDKDDGEVVRMKAIPDEQSLSQLKPRPGAKVIADVRVGKRAAGFVLGYEVYEWLCKFFF
jgi:hypothetical protein